MRRVVITGIGIVSSIGNNVDEVTTSLRNGTSGIVVAPEYTELGFRSQVHGTVKLDVAEHIDRKQLRFMGEGAAYAVLAMEQALASSATAECLKGASDALAVANAEHGDVDVVVENFAEACDDAQDVTDQLAAPLGDVEDDDALLAELGMGPEAAVLPAPAAPPAAAAAPAAPAAPTADALGMPRAPTASLALEDEMKQLEREAMAT